VSLPLLRSLLLYHTTIPAAVLAHLLGSRTLKSRCVLGPPPWQLDLATYGALLCDALRANTQLETLQLESVGLWRDIEAAAAVMTALQTHPSLRSLKLLGNTAWNAAAAGAALGALIQHSHTLMELDIRSCYLGDAGMGPIAEALPHARQLRELKCLDNRMSKAFARERMLPAVASCAPLRELEVEEYGGVGVAFDEARRLLRQRR
jgi:hypothetical protein